MSDLRWHYGEDARMWCYDCDAEVWYLGGGWICTGCGRGEDNPEDDG